MSRELPWSCNQSRPTTPERVHVYPQDHVSHATFCALSTCARDSARPPSLQVKDFNQRPRTLGRAPMSEPKPHGRSSRVPALDMNSFFLARRRCVYLRAIYSSVSRCGSRHTPSSCREICFLARACARIVMLCRHVLGAANGCPGHLPFTDY